MKIIGIKNSGIPNTYDITLTASLVGDELSFDIVTINNLVEDQTSDQYRSEDSATVNLAVLRQQTDWCDYQAYILALQDNKFQPIFSLYQAILGTNETPVQYAQRNNLNMVIAINVPFATSTNDDIFITVNLSSGAQDANLITSGLEEVWSTLPNANDVRLQLFPYIQAIPPASIEVNSASPVPVRIEDINGNLIDVSTTIYVQALTGFSGGTQVNITGGTGNLPISSAGMISGDIVSMNLGWKYYPTAKNITVPVV